MFLLVLAAGLAGAAVGQGTTGLVAPHRPASGRPAARSAGPGAGAPLPPPLGVVDRLPGDGRSLALTIDDGTNSEVVAAFAAFAVDAGVRLTFFPNGRYSSWEDNAPALRKLVDSGQVVFGNHTWSHPDLTTLGDAQVVDEIRRNQVFLRNTFGVRDSPFFRPPFGARNERTDRISADLGHPTVVMWNGTLEDSRVLTSEQLVSAARKWFAEQAIIVGHANHPTVTKVYDELLGVISDRDLTTVTLADVWATPQQRIRGAAVSGRAATT